MARIWAITPSTVSPRITSYNVCYTKLLRKYLYTDIPFFIGLSNGRAYGMLFDNTFRSYFEMASESDDYYYFYANGGPLSYYFFNGPKIADVLKRRITSYNVCYTKLLRISSALTKARIFGSVFKFSTNWFAPPC